MEPSAIQGARTGREYEALRGTLLMGYIEQSRGERLYSKDGYEVKHIVDLHCAMMVGVRNNLQAKIKVKDTLHLHGLPGLSGFSAGNRNIFVETERTSIIDNSQGPNNLKMEVITQCIIIDGDVLGTRRSYKCDRHGIQTEIVEIKQGVNRGDILRLMGMSIFATHTDPDIYPPLPTFETTFAYNAQDWYEEFLGDRAMDIIGIFAPVLSAKRSIQRQDPGSLLDIFVWGSNEDNVLKVTQDGFSDTAGLGTEFSEREVFCPMSRGIQGDYTTEKRCINNYICTYIPSLTNVAPDAVYSYFGLLCRVIVNIVNRIKFFFSRFFKKSTPPRMRVGEVSGSEVFEPQLLCTPASVVTRAPVLSSDGGQGCQSNSRSTERQPHASRFASKSEDGQDIGD